MLDVRRLRVLCAVADHPSLSAAADALSYTPSAVSQQIVALEREVGVRLLHRGPRGVKLTATGRVLVEHARPILSGLQVAEESIAALTGLNAGKLHLACFATAGATVLPQAIAIFRRRHPEVELILSQADPDDAMVRLRAGDVDLIITADVELVEDRAIEAVHLFDDLLYAVLPAAHPLAQGERVRLEDLAAETWVDPPRARRRAGCSCSRADRPGSSPASRSRATSTPRCSTSSRRGRAWRSSPGSPSTRRRPGWSSSRSRVAEWSATSWRRSTPRSTARRRRAPCRRSCRRARVSANARPSAVAVP